MDRQWPRERLVAVLSGLAGLWVRYMIFAAAAGLVIGAYPPIGMVALLLSLGLPILALALWGRSIDEDLGWGDREDGPW